MEFRNVIILFFLFISLSGCVKYLDFPDIDHQPKLILYAILEPEKPIIGSINRTFGISEQIASDPIFLDLEGFYIQQPIQLDYDPASRIFESDFNLAISSLIRLEAKSSFYGNISAEVEIPEPVVLGEMFFEDSVYIHPEYGVIGLLHLEILDDGTKERYYEVSFRVDYFENKEREVPIAGEVFFNNVVDPILVAEDILDFSPTTLVFSNSYFDGYSQKLRIHYSKANTGILRPLEYQINMNINTISESLYMFKKTLIKHRATKFPDILDGFGEKIDVYSNVDGGYGVLGAQNPRVDTVFKMIKK